MFKRGVFIISIDTELAWGTFDHGGHIKYREAYAKYRQIIAKLLELFERYEISATWAIVGHLFLDSCCKNNGKLHPEIVRPTHKWFKGDWFSLDPGTDISKDNFWYGSDIIKMVMKATPRQEIASHSFSHPVFSDIGCSREAAESDIAKCVDLADRYGIKLRSFVFPRNKVAYLDILAKYGFRAFRGNGAASSRVDLKPAIMKKIEVLLRDVVGATPPTVWPLKAKSGLTGIPSSMLFRFAHGASKIIPGGIRSRQGIKGIEAAIKNKGIFHLWFHPISFGWKTEELFDEFEEILAYASLQKKAARLEFLTLDEISGDQHLDSDSLNPESIILHNQRSVGFKKEYSDNLAEYYQNAFKYGRKKIEEALRLFLSGFQPNSRILDVGCGTGYFLNLASQHKLRCCGVDLSHNMLKELKQTYARLNVFQADARRLPFGDNSFDAVLSVETLRYFKDRNVLLNEIYRVTKPGGYVFITAAPLFSGNIYGLYNTLCRVLNFDFGVSCYQSFETINSLYNRLRNSGFMDTDIKGCFWGPYFIFDKINSGINSFLLPTAEKLDMKLSRYNFFRNISNHLICIAKKPIDSKM